MLDTFWTLGQEILLQEFVAESRGQGRARAGGGRPGGGRHAPHRERASSAPTSTAAARAEAIALAREYAEAAVKAARVMGLEVAGRGHAGGARPGPKIMEMNSARLRGPGGRHRRRHRHALRPARRGVRAHAPLRLRRRAFIMTVRPRPAGGAAGPHPCCAGPVTPAAGGAASPGELHPSLESAPDRVAHPHRRARRAGPLRGPALTLVPRGRAPHRRRPRARRRRLHAAPARALPQRRAARRLQDRAPPPGPVRAPGRPRAGGGRHHARPVALARPAALALPALAALAAARLQGRRARPRFRAALREASLVRGIERDAARRALRAREPAGLDLARFAGASRARHGAARPRDATTRRAPAGYPRRAGPGDRRGVAGGRGALGGRSTAPCLHRYASASSGLPPVRLPTRAVREVGSLGFNPTDGVVTLTASRPRRTRTRSAACAGFTPWRARLSPATGRSAEMRRNRRFLAAGTTAARMRDPECPRRRSRPSIGPSRRRSHA